MHNIGKIINEQFEIIDIDKVRTKEKGRKHYLLKCLKCNEILSRRSDNLNHIKCKCTPRYYQQNNDKRVAEMINKQFGLLTVLSYVDNKRSPDGSLIYKCKCNCGNICEISGTNLRKGTQSCGCLIGKNKNPNIEDLSNQKFNNITLLSMTEKRDASRCVIYKARCDCGKIFEISGTKVKNGFTKSCGCLQKINLQKYLETVNYATDETGNIYGKLKVLYRNGSTSNWQAIWHCKCDCGKELDIPGTRLRSGQISCGCLSMSKEVYNIFQILQNNNISFETEKKYSNCRDISYLPFDFFIDNEYIIEFDGIQHFHSFEHFGGKKKFILRHKHDLIKNKYCFDNNIPLIRIPYDAEYTLDDLKLETTRFLLTPENEQEYYDSRKENI